MIKKLGIKTFRQPTSSWLWDEIARKLVEFWTDTEVSINELKEYDKIKVIWTSWAGKTQTAINYVMENIENISKVYYFTSKQWG